MKVLLKEDVENLGLAGEVRKVADGFGRNYLLPRGLAEVASPTAMKRAEYWRSRAEARREQIKAEYEALAERISGVSLEFEAKAGSTGKLYGSVTTSDIAAKLAAELGIEVDRRKLESDPLRQIGEHKVAMRLDKDHMPEFTVVINPDGELEDEPEEEEAPVEEYYNEFDEFEDDEDF